MLRSRDQPPHYQLLKAYIKSACYLSPFTKAQLSQSQSGARRSSIMNKSLHFSERPQTRGPLVCAARGKNTQSQ